MLLRHSHMSDGRSLIDGNCHPYTFLIRTHVNALNGSLVFLFRGERAMRLQILALIMNKARIFESKTHD